MVRMVESDQSRPLLGITTQMFSYEFHLRHLLVILDKVYCGIASIYEDTWQVDINVATFNTLETSVELGAHNILMFSRPQS